MINPITTSKQAGPGRFDAQVLPRFANAKEGVNSLIMLQDRMEQVSPQFREGTVRVYNDLGQQRSVGLSQQLRRVVDMHFDRAAACFPAPIHIGWLQPV